MTASAAATAPKLDDLMLAMDVVDTIRHREDVLSRELTLGDKDEELIEKLRQIYTEQGITVTDTVLKEGVKALKESRFQYKSPPGGLITGMFHLWVGRGNIVRWVGSLLVAAGLGWAAYTYGFIEPQKQTAEQARIEISETLPKTLATQLSETRAASQDPKATRQIEALGLEAAAAIKANNATAAKESIRALADVQAALDRTYSLRIVNKQGQSSAVWRTNNQSAGGRNHYLIVEALDPQGKILTLPIEDEETRETRNVAMFGVRVPFTTYEAVRVDKQDNGLIEDDIVGTKPRGKLDIDFAMPASARFLTATN